MNKVPSQCGKKVRARRGSAYVVVLGAVMIVTLAGLSAVTLTRVQHKAVVDNAAVTLARLAAQSAVEVGVYRILNDATWRRKASDDTWSLFEPIGPYKLTFKQVDEIDGTIGNNMDDPVRVYCKALMGNAVRIHSVLLERHPVVPNAAIASGLHAGGDLTVDVDAVLKVTGGVVSADGKFTNAGEIRGDVHAPALAGNGVILGDVIATVKAKEMPDLAKVASLVASATIMPFAGDIEYCVIAPGYNEYCESGNPSGIYYLDTQNQDIVISNVRVHGTLIVNAGENGSVCVGNQVLIESSHSDLPALVIIGDTRFEFTSSGSTAERYLVEASMGHNFNPPAAPYAGESDIDMSDHLPSEIRGLVHIVGNLELVRTSGIRGVIVCTGNVDVSDTPWIIGAPDILANPPRGYAPRNLTSMDTQMRVVQGSLRRDVGGVTTADDNLKKARGGRTPSGP